jgi:hypothetical protein
MNLGSSGTAHNEALNLSPRFARRRLTPVRYLPRLRRGSVGSGGWNACETEQLSVPRIVMKNRRTGRLTVSPRVVDHLVQGVLIFASVFLAFWLNDYRVQVGERRATEAALDAVINEVRTNQAVLERWAPYHREIGDRMEARLLAPDAGTGEAFNPFEVMGGRGIFQEILTYDSWEYLRQTDVRLDLETRLAVNRIFRQQEYVDQAVRETVVFLNGRELLDPERGSQNQLIFYRLIEELYHQQVAMLDSYGRFLERFE